MPFLAGRGQAGRGMFGLGTTPGAPTGLVATKSNAQISVAFTAPVFDGGLPITTYQFALSTDGFTTFTTRSTGTTASPLVITGLTNGNSIEVKLRAVNSLGAGAASVASTAVTPSTVPDAPATPTVNALDAGDTITWTEPNNGGSAIAQYYYKVSTNNGASYGAETFVAAGATLSYATGNQYSASTFKIQVRAENANGTSGFSTASANTVAWAPNPDTVTENYEDDSCGTGTCSQTGAAITCQCGYQYSNTVTRTASRTRSRSKTTNFFSRAGSTSSPTTDTTAFNIDNEEWNLGDAGTVGYGGITYNPANFPANTYGACDNSGTQTNVTESYGYNTPFNFAGTQFLTEYVPFMGYRAYVYDNFNYSYGGGTMCAGYQFGEDTAYHLLYVCSITNTQSVVFVGCSSAS